MRSEKEIEKVIEIALQLYESTKRKDIKECNIAIVWAFRFALQGEPRYSIAELEKIDKWIQENAKVYPIRFSEFIYFLKDKKKVEEILK